MKPIKLQFKGINSFSEQTEIDFEKLTKSGIFGIFGDTGSGKSTILDCINFALYGKVERSKEKSDIINYRSDAAEVKFEFDVLTEGKRKRYAVDRSIKRKSGIHKATLYEDEKCIADNASTVTKKITEILGVDAEDFRKCIALPQGEFSQFVKSQPSERISLIERLFSLYKYGDRLKDRIKLRESEAELNYRTVYAKLDTYTDVSPEKIEELETVISECEKLKEKLSEESIAADKEYTDLKLLGDKAAELNEAVKKLTELEVRKPEMDELKAGLEAAPVCKSVVETDSEITLKTNLLNLLNDELKKIALAVETEKQKIYHLNLCIENEKFDERIAECIRLSAKYAACEGKPEKIVELGKRLEGKRNQYRVKEAELNNAKQKLSKTEIAVNEADVKLKNCGAADFDRLINVDFRGAVLRDEYVSVLDYYVGLNGQVKFHKDNSELYKFISAELKQQIDIYKDRVYQVKDFNLKEAEEQLKKLQSSTKEREELTAELNNRKADLKDAQTAVENCIKELNLILRDGEELKAQADDIKEELKKVFGKSEKFIETIKANEATLEKLKTDKEKISLEIEKANKALTELSARQAAKSVEKRTVEEAIVKLKETYKTLLEKSGLEDLESCKKLAEEFSKFANAEKALEEYSAELSAVKARIKALEKIKGIQSFTDTVLIVAEKRKNDLAKKLAEEREKFAVYVSDLKKASARLTEKQKLIKELSSAEKERNLIAQLKELTKGNKFMEFIANEYLYDISSLASGTLLNLTDGRYFLTYTDNFYAGDNFNCGNLRGVNTLSGGETFLVSLSLALALSQTICASLKSIEFFFLDEGFGTLDSSLVDTVMNALEKLKSSSFTIGIISHVEELKHRIDNKITVNKATESHGSTVHLSC